MALFGDKLKLDHKKYEKLKAALFESQEKGIIDDVSTKKEELDIFVEIESAKDIFEKYSKKKPFLIEIKTGTKIGWIEAFGTDFDKISKSLRHSLVGLEEGGGRYKL